MNKVKTACGGSVTDAFERSGHAIERTSVPLSFFRELSQSECNLLALTTYPLAKKRMVYVLTLVFIVIASLIYSILASIEGGLFFVVPDAPAWAMYSWVGIAIFIVSLLLCVITFPFAENALSGFYILDGGKRLGFGGFVRFLYGLARVLTFVFGFVLILIVGLLGGSFSGDGENKVVIGVPHDCEPEDVPELYNNMFR